MNVEEIRTVEKSDMENYAIGMRIGPASWADGRASESHLKEL